MRMELRKSELVKKKQQRGFEAAIQKQLERAVATGTSGEEEE